MTTRRDVASPLEVAAAQSLLAHRALGRMSACATASEFADAASELLAAARGISQALAILARMSANDGSDRRRAFAAWFALNVRDLLQHELDGLLASTKPPPVYMTRLARGSDSPPIRDDIMLGRSAALHPKPEDFFFEGADRRPAIELCADYVERVTKLLDESRLAMKRFGLE